MGQETVGPGRGVLKPLGAVRDEMLQQGGELVKWGDTPLHGREGRAYGHRLSESGRNPRGHPSDGIYLLSETEASEHLSGRVHRGN